ncbi:MAG: type II secretion system F family protein [Candidatus Altiarchaeota archaeon]
MQKELGFLKQGFIRSASHLFIGVGDVLTHVFTHTKLTLTQSGIKEQYNLAAREYLAICFTTGLLVGLSIGGFTTLAIYLGDGKDPQIGALTGGMVGFVIFFYLTMYPKSIVSKRNKYIERNLLFALRSLLVQIRSGVPIFNAMASIALGNYGPISEEFRNVVEKVNAGQPMVDSLESLALRNPSIYFRRALWQLVNSLKSGSDVGENLEEVIRSLSKEQLVEIGRYKSVLNPIAMMYMMVAVIIPSLGITMLIILSSFPGMEMIGKESTFWMLLAGILVLQFIFLGLIKSKRPNLIGG